MARYILSTCFRPAVGPKTFKARTGDVVSEDAVSMPFRLKVEPNKYF